MALIQGGWVGGGGGGGGGQVSRRWALPAIRPDSGAVFSADDRDVHKPQDQDGHWQQFGIQPILLSVPQWANRPCNAPT